MGQGKREERVRERGRGGSPPSPPVLSPPALSPPPALSSPPPPLARPLSEEVLFQLRALQEALEEDLTLRLTRQAAAKQQLLWQRDERDFLAQKLQRIEPVCQEHMGCYSAAQVSAIILAPLPCMQ